MIHLIEVEGERPEDGEIVWTKCGMELEFRPFSPSLEKMVKICVDCDTRGPTKIPNFLSVVALPLSKRTGA